MLQQVAKKVKAPCLGAYGAFPNGAIGLILHSDTGERQDESCGSVLCFSCSKPCGFRIRRKAEAQVLGEHQWKMTQQWA